MPTEIYGTLYNQNDLATVITMVKDIYAKKPEQITKETALFLAISSKNVGAKDN